MCPVHLAIWNPIFCLQTMDHCTEHIHGFAADPRLRKRGLIGESLYPPDSPTAPDRPALHRLVRELHDHISQQRDALCGRLHGQRRVPPCVRLHPAADGQALQQAPALRGDEVRGGPREDSSHRGRPSTAINFGNVSERIDRYLNHTLPYFNIPASFKKLNIEQTVPLTDPFPRDRHPRPAAEPALDDDHFDPRSPLRLHQDAQQPRDVPARLAADKPPSKIRPLGSTISECRTPRSDLLGASAIHLPSSPRMPKSNKMISSIVVSILLAPISGLGALHPAPIDSVLGAMRGIRVANGGAPFHIVDVVPVLVVDGCCARHGVGIANGGAPVPVSVGVPHGVPVSTRRATGRVKFPTRCTPAPYPMSIPPATSTWSASPHSFLPQLIIDWLIQFYYLRSIISVDPLLTGVVFRVFGLQFFGEFTGSSRLFTP